MTTEEMQALRAMMEEVVAPIKEDVNNINKRLDKIEDRTSRIESTIENTLVPAIQLLAEGQQNILEHIEEKVTSKYEELDDRVTALEAAYRELKRAQ